MKKCKIIHINDGRSVELTNGNRLYMEEFEVTENQINKLLNDGWTVKHIVPDYSPSMQKEGNFTFYKGGLTFYLEKEV